MRCQPITLLAILLCLPAVAAAQEPLDAAKNLYASAAYEEALSALDKVEAPALRTEADQYRAFCLIALDRSADAQKAIAAVVTASPTYLPDPADVSPRIRDAFLKVRRELLPDLSRRLYLEAKSALDKKDRAAAVAGFRTVLQVIDASAPVEGDVAELRLLSEGFLQLSEALRAAESPKPDAAAAATPKSASRLPVVKPAVVINQTLPAWNPGDAEGRFREFAGAIRVTIGADGKVKSAEIVRSIHPAYNQVLLRAAANWVYEPAREDGVPVESEKTVEVRLSPR